MTRNKMRKYFIGIVREDVLTVVRDIEVNVNVVIEKIWSGG